MHGWLKGISNSPSSLCDGGQRIKGIHYIFFFLTAFFSPLVSYFVLGCSRLKVDWQIDGVKHSDPEKE